MMQGKAGEAQATSQAAALRRNAAYMGNAAADARARGTKSAGWARVETGQNIGTQRAAMAGSGGVVDSGSNAIIQQDTAQLGELDALTISNNAAREAYGYEVQAADNLYTAKNVVKQAKKNTMTSILGGAMQGAGSAYGAGSFGGAGKTAGAGTTSAMSGSTSRLNYNQAYA